jgi:hypothetical protein
MNYADINAAHVLPERQRSLFAILDTAKTEAVKNGVSIYVLHAPEYVDEFATGEHVYAPREGVAVLFPNCAVNQESCDALIGSTGEVLLMKLPDLSVVAQHVTTGRVTIEVEAK